MRVHKPSTQRMREVLGHQEQTVPVPTTTQEIQPRRPEPPRRELRPLGAVVFLPPGTAGVGVWTDACGEYIEARGYRLAAVCSKWADAIKMCFDGLADVIVVGRRDHLPRDRTPRVDVVTEAVSTSEHHRRPRRQK